MDSWLNRISRLLVKVITFKSSSFSSSEMLAAVPFSLPFRPDSCSDSQLALGLLLSLAGIALRNSFLLKQLARRHHFQISLCLGFWLGLSQH
jgi:hypothetical protein